MTTYQYNNRIFRALDIYHFPESISLHKQLDAINTLVEHIRSRRARLFNAPTLHDLEQRFEQLQQTHVLEEDRNHLLDTAYVMGTNVPRHTKENRPLTLKQLAQDSHNVHNTHVNNSVKQLCVKLCAQFSTTELSLLKISTVVAQLRRVAGWTNDNKKAIYIIRTTDYTFGIDLTLRQVFLSLFLYITRKLKRHQEELLTRLNQELLDMTGTCSTGHLSRLINVLQGYDEAFTHQCIDVQTKLFRLLTDYLKEQGVVDVGEIRTSVLAYVQTEAFHTALGVPVDATIEKIIDSFLGESI
jgi:hypothetical protein